MPPEVTNRREGGVAQGQRTGHLQTTLLEDCPGSPSPESSILCAQHPEPGRTQVRQHQAWSPAQALSSLGKSQALIAEPLDPDLSPPSLCTWFSPIWAHFKMANNRSPTQSQTETGKSLTFEIEFRLSHSASEPSLSFTSPTASPPALFPSAALNLPPVSLPSHLAESS